jgi:hypothetical protein
MSKLFPESRVIVRGVSLVPGLLSFLLAACSAPAALTRFSYADAQNAVSMAQAATFDPNAAVRVPCWQAWGTFAGSLSKGSTSGSGSGAVGLFSMTEASLEVNAAFNSPACQAVASQVLFNLVRWSLPVH